MGGTNNQLNIVRLTAREHFLCHALLVKIHPKNQQLKYAAWAMCNQTSNKNMVRTYKINSKIYEALKIQFSLVMRTRPKKRRTPEQGLAQSIRQTGKTHTTKYTPKQLKFSCSCTECTQWFLSADVNAKICKPCKLPKPCRCGCGKIVRTPGRYFSLGHKNKGKTYFEIYGTSTPNCGHRRGEDNIAKRVDIRKKISDGVKASYTPELLELRRRQCPFTKQ